MTAKVETQQLPAALREVVRALEAGPRAPAARLAAALHRPIGIDDVAPWIRFDAENYVRSRVAFGDGWELRLLCWRPKQTSSLHGHGAAECAFRVIRGSAIETSLGQRDRVLPPGSVVEEPGSSNVHQVGNAGPDALLTLHAYAPPLPIDAPSPRQGRDVVIVGGGASGVAVAIHLLRRGDRALRVYLVERGPWIGRGVAYGVDSAVFRLNVPASRMSVDPERPDEFATWAGAGANAFLPRAKFADYLVARLAEEVRRSPAKLRIVRGEAIAVDEQNVRLLDGSKLSAETVVLATGIEPRVAPSSLPTDARIIDAWDECALAGLPHTGRVLVLGAGLSAIDVVAWLDAHAFTGSVTILSRHGLLPRPHLSPPSAAASLEPERVARAPADLRGLLRWGRAVIRAQEELGYPWQSALDSLRPHLARLYSALPPRQRARFVRSVRPYWDVLRHRAPPGSLALVDSLRQAGRLEVLAGRIELCRVESDALDVALALAHAPPRRERFDAIVRCIGPALELSEADAPLDRALVASGLAAADPAGLGIVTDGVGRVIGASGEPSERILSLGAVRRASSWETTSIPDIAVHALALAKRILP